MTVKIICHFPQELKLATKTICDTEGNWADWITEISPLHCAIGESGTYEPSSMTITLKNENRYFYTYMSGENRKIAGKKVEILTENNTLLYKGTVEKWKITQTSFTIYLSDIFDLEKKYPLRVLSKKEYPECTGEGTVIPILYGNHNAPEGAVKCQKAKIDGYLVSENPCQEVTAVFDPEKNPITTGWRKQNDPDGSWVYFTAGQGTYDYIQVNVKGKAAGGDLITGPIDQLTDLLTGQIEMDAAAFAAVKTKMANRRYQANIALTKETSIREILDKFAKTFDCEFFVNYSNQLTVDMIDFRGREAEKHYQMQKINGLEIEENPGTCKNRVKYMYAYIPGREDFLYRPVYETQTDYPGGYEPLPLYYTGDWATAYDVAQRYVVKNRAPQRTISMTLRHDDFSGMERGKIIDIIPLNGLYGDYYQIRSYEIDIRGGSVKVILRDISTLSERLLVLGERGKLPGKWTQANQEQRKYGYLSDRETGRYTTGELGRVLY